MAKRRRLCKNCTAGGVIFFKNGAALPAKGRGTRGCSPGFIGLSQLSQLQKLTKLKSAQPVRSTISSTRLPLAPCQGWLRPGNF